MMSLVTVLKEFEKFLLFFYR